eukprot:c21511_g5_i1.p1 GENE.c21511_g5_i1~~c21511_g5_i1.p1  ORF type:complete len:479 (-),score=105.12 c21511_g5_i1:4-1440(-)
MFMKQSWNIYIFILFCNSFCLCSKLEIYNSNSTILEEYDILSPGFSLGNLDFPVSGKIVFGRGCNGINQIAQENQFENISNFSSKYIAFLEFGNGGCFTTAAILQCQKQNWCGGILFRDSFFKPAGLPMLIKFDKHRARNEYKVPAAQSSFEDFDQVRELIAKALKNNQTYKFTLINDQNPWIEMFASVIFLILFRIISHIWSVGCLLLIVYILYSQYKKANRLSNLKNSTIRFQKIGKGLTLKQVCLLLHGITHIFRIAFFVDPFSGQQIYSYPIQILLQMGSIIFEISTSMLLSIVVRELTHSTNSIDFSKFARIGYFIVILFISFAVAAVSLEALQYTESNISPFLVLALFYSIATIVLGIWYFWQGYVFFKKCSKIEKNIKKSNQKKLALTQMSMFNSIGMIFFGIGTISISQRSVYGKPWGFFLINFFLVLIFQITSLFEVLLFGGVTINLGWWLKKGFFDLYSKSVSQSVSV